jgi:hypothetical protein
VNKNVDANVNINENVQINVNENENVNDNVNVNENVNVYNDAVFPRCPASLHEFVINISVRSMRYVR